MRVVQSLAQHWSGTITLSLYFHICCLAVFILPLEISLTSDNAIFASFLFLPHAVRVLSEWLLVPKSLLAMITAGVAVSLMDDATPGFNVANNINSLCCLISGDSI